MHWGNFFEDRPKNFPCFLLLDDLHWSDPSTEEFIEYFSQNIKDVPILLCLVYRRDFEPHWEKPASYHHLLHLHPLAEKEGEELVEQLVESSSLPDTFRDLVLQRSEFNPLFIEEVIRKLITEEILIQKGGKWEQAKPFSEEVVPENLLSLIQARIDRLEDSTRQVLQAGSVIGRQFAMPLLEFLEIVREGLQDKLETLEGLEFLHKRLDRESVEYVFHHAMTREVAYNALLNRHKRHLHERVAEAIEKLYGEDSEAHFPLLAYHYLKAENQDPALKYLVKAADRAKRIYANREAIELYHQAIDVLLSLPGTPENKATMLHTLIRQSSIHRILGEIEECEEDLKRALDIAEDLEDSSSLAKVRIEYGLLHQVTADYGDAEKQAREGLEIASAIKNPDLEMQAWNVLGIVALKTGKYSECREAFEKEIPLAEAAGNRLYAVNAHNNLGLMFGDRGDPGKAMEHHRMALQIREELKDEMGQAASLNNLGILYENAGRLEEAERYYRKSLNLAERTGYKEGVTAILANLGQLKEMEGSLTRALEYNSRSLKSAEESGDRRSMGIALDNLGNVYSIRREYGEAENSYSKALALAELTGERDVESRSLLGLAFVDLVQGNIDEAEQGIQNAEAIIDELSLESARSRLYRAKAQLAKAKNESESAVQLACAALESAQNGNLWRESELAKQLMEELKTV